jgi:2-methylisocitrate lyase-like PEP mutase family enzyme
VTGAQKLRELLRSPGVLQCGGVADAGQGLLVQKVGYPVAYMSGAYVNHTRGFPDGTLTLSEIAERAREISERLSIPLIADGDEGFGGILKLIRTVQEFERGGVAGLHLEDMLNKKHGDLLSVPEAANRLRAALDARVDSNFVVIARTDALAPWRPGLNDDIEGAERDAFERCQAYADVGADLVMPIYASMDWFRRYGPKLNAPCVLLGGAAKTWPGLAPGKLELDFPADELEAFKVKLVIYGTSMLSRSFAFMEQQYSKWLSEGRFASNAQDELDRTETLKLVGLLEKEEILRKYGA